jgi:carbonic anhydrase/acetyltransferase-like protein (isoleucine patch superfamily)
VRRALVLWLRTVQLWDRLWLRLLPVLHPGLEIHPEAGSALAVARFRVAPGARVRIARGVVTERIRGALHVYAEAGSEIEIGEGTWLRTEVGEIHLVAFAGARLVVGPEGLLNGCHVSAKREVTLGRRVWVGMGSRIFDADQHDLDAERAEVVAPVRIGDCVWIASDVTLLRGVSIGEHSVIGARSLVTADVPPHTLAFGQPARPRGRVGDRSKTR